MRVRLYCSHKGSEYIAKVSPTVKLGVHFKNRGEHNITIAILNTINATGETYQEGDIRLVGGSYSWEG